MMYVARVLLLFPLMFAPVVPACDAMEADTEAGASSTGDGAPPPSGPCGPLCTPDWCPPECYPDPCGTVGDWCDIGKGDLQCGERMACRVVSGSGSASGVCVAPCDAADPFGCAVGKCDPDIGACVGDGGVLVASAVCD
jgi:hypothetical protein